MKKFKPFFLPFILVLLVGISYANSLNNGFVSDDISGIVESASGWTFPSVAVTKTVIHAQMLVWYAVYKLFGLDPWAFRLVNILCHAVSVLLVWAIVFQLSRQISFIRAASSAGACPERSRRIAFFSASLFAVHPIIIESVAWISGGIYCQYGMLFLLSFWMYLKSKELEDRSSRIGVEGRGLNVERNSSIIYRLLSSAVFLLCLLFSEKAIVLFPLFFLYEFCFGNLKQNWRKLIPYFIVSIIPILFYSTKIGGRIEGVAVESGGKVQGLFNPLIQLPIAITSYFELIVWPKNLTLYHSEMQFTTLNYVIRLLVFLGYCGGIILTAMKKRKLCFWLLWFLVPLLPTLTPLKISWVVAERYAYLSVIGLFVLIAYWFEWVFCLAQIISRNDMGPAARVSRNRPHDAGMHTFSSIPGWSRSMKSIYSSSSTLLRAVAGTLARVTRFLSLFNLKRIFSAGSADKFEFFAKGARTSVRDRRTLEFGRATSAHVRNYFLLCVYLVIWVGILGALIFRTHVRNRDWYNEDTLWVATAKTSPSIPYTWNNMGDVYSRHGNYKKAAEMFQRAITLNPNYAPPYNNLGEVYRDMGQIGDAILVYEKALDLNPDLWQSHAGLAKIYIMKKDYQSALSHIEEALKIVPDNQQLLRARDQIRKMLE